MNKDKPLSLRELIFKWIDEDPNMPFRYIKMMDGGSNALPVISGRRTWGVIYEDRVEITAFDIIFGGTGKQIASVILFAADPEFFPKLKIAMAI